MRWRYPVALAGAGLAGGLVWFGINRPDVAITAIRATRTKVVASVESITPDHVAARAQAVPARPSPTPVAAAPRAVVDGRDLVDKLVRAERLDERQRVQLTRHLKLVAAMQERIDRHTDPVERASLENKLLHQLEVRLRLVLGEEEATRTFASLAAGRPRVVFTTGGAP